MTLSDLLPPERVREIAQQYAPPYGSMTELRMAAINAAAPEIARAVLLEAARRIDAMPVDAARCRILMLPEQAWEEGQDAASGMLRKMAEEIKP